MKKSHKLVIWTCISLSIIALGVYIFFSIAVAMAFDYPGPEDIPLEKTKALRLIKDFEAYGKIFEMDDATRCHKSLNDEPLNFSDFSDSEGSSCNYGYSLEELLAKFEIDRLTYLDFRTRLENTQLHQYCRYENIHVYIVDGMLDTVWGYCYSPEKLDTNKEWFNACNYTLKITKDLGDNWYLIGGS